MSIKKKTCAKILKACFLFLQINSLKERGNNALTAGNFDEAISLYTEAINLDDKNHVLLSNRSAAYAKAEKFEDALKDAEKTIEVNPTWAKGYSRKGAALMAMQNYSEALMAVNKGKNKNESFHFNEKYLHFFKKLFIGIEIEPSNSALQQLKNDVEEAFLRQFQDQMTRQSGPMDVDPQSPFTTKSAKKDPIPPPKQPTEDDNLPENKKLAKKEKDLGNDAYKKKDFDTAIKHYQKAMEHDPTDITFYTNNSAVYFEQKDYVKCIAECEKGIEIGREARADYKLIAKAFTRIGNSYRKLADYKQAKVFYEKAMSEHRTPEVKSLLSEMEKKIKEDALRSYIDPVKAEEEKELGNDYFKKGEYSNAVKHYSEAIRRNPEDPKLYSNRAACYTKLVAFDLGLKDCDKCVELDNKFIKGWIRKGKILQGMQQQSKALAAYQKALEIDSSNSEAVEGYRNCTVAVHSNPEEIFKKAMNDPEIQSILKDPAMRLILEQMQSDPKAVQE